MSSSVAIKTATITPGIGLSFQLQCLDQAIPKNFLNHEFRAILRPFPGADRNVTVNVSALDALNGVLQVQVPGASSLAADMRYGEFWSGMLLSRVVGEDEWLPEVYIRCFVEVL